jgi:hypothetical protein
MNKRYSVLVLLGLFLAGCSELEQVPQSTATRSAVFSNTGGLDLYVNSFYEGTNTGVLPNGNDIIRSDEMADFAARTQVPDFLRDGAYGPRQSTGWDWRPLRNINFFIANCTDPAIPVDTRRHYLGLARFFRAWFYFDKVKRFGDVPWIGQAMRIDDPALYNGRDPRAVVMDSVLADLDYATQNIKTTTDNSRSLITKGVAYGFKSRVCLFEGTFRKYRTSYNLGSTADKWLTEAVNAADKVMKEGGFSLNETGGNEKSYRQLFISDGTPFTDKPGYQTMTFMDEVKGRDKRLQQTIRMGNYTRTNGGAVEAAPPVFSYTYTGYMPIKWSLDDTYYDGGTRNINSISIMRYAEILLNYAEAKTELGTLTNDDWAKTVGALRKRAGITAGLTTKPTVADAYLKANYFPNISDPTLLEVRRERGIELVLEGFRFSDIIRWNRGPLMEQTWNGFYVPALDKPLDLNEDGKNDVVFYKVKPATQLPGVTYINVAETVNGNPNPQRLKNDTSGELTWLNNITRKWDDKFYLYPIPENDRLVNPKIGQNPGW